MAHQKLLELASAPAGPSEGWMYYDTTLHALGVYNGSEWLYGSGSGWTGGGGGFTEIDGNLTLGGEPVAATPPTSGGPYGLVYNGTDWVSEFVQTNTELAGHFTLDSEAIAITGLAGAQALVFNGSNWVNDAVMPAAESPALGYELFTDGSGNTYWENPGNDELQAGFLGATNPVTATINSSTGVLTFSNFPNNQTAWFLTSSGVPMRGTTPVTAPSALTVSGVTSGDYAYLAMYISCPSTPGGAGAASLVVGTSRTTAALAAADQVGAAAQNGKTLVWDGIAHLASSVWSLVAGTPASGSIIPAATGRDRRPWARGARGRIAYVAGASYTISATTPTPIDTTNLAFRLECSGVPIDYEFLYDWSSSTAEVLVELFMDGALAGSTGADVAQTDGTAHHRTLRGTVVPSSGSHLFEPIAWVFAGSGSGLLSAPRGHHHFWCREDVTVEQVNGTA